MTEVGMADEKDGPLGTSKRKLVESKERWAREGRLLTRHTARPAEQRLPPGQRQVTNCPVLDLGIQSDVPAERWQLTIDGVVETPVTWDWAAFRAQPAFRDVSDIHCVTAWSRFDNAWEGISAAQVRSTLHRLPQLRRLHHQLAAGRVRCRRRAVGAFVAGPSVAARAWRARAGDRAAALFLEERQSGSGASSSSPPTARASWEVRGYHDRGDPWTEERYG
jgi:DMSO/TMAO reductase YedYZ molybdopterin-dependent catalytic subunit